MFAAIQVPLTVSDGTGGMAGLNAWYPKYASTEMGDVKFCLGHMLAPIIFRTTKRIERPADLSGLKIRPSSTMEAAFSRNAGGATVPGGTPEARKMISRGVVDGTTGVVGSQFVFGVTEATKYHLDMPFSAVSFVVVINKDKYDGMTDAQKTVIYDHCNAEAAAKFFSAPQVFEEEGSTSLRTLTDGREVVTPSAKVQAEWRAAAQPVRDGRARDMATASVTRHLCNWPIPDGDSIARMLLAVVVFWGFAAACLHGEHIRLDLFTERLPPRLRAAVCKLTGALVFCAVATATWAAWHRVGDLRGSGKITCDLGLTLWPFYALAFLGLVAASLVLLAMLVGW